MATATWIQRFAAEPPPDVINLILTLEEAEILRTVVGSIIGCEGGPRGIVNHIYHALNGAGVSRAQHVTVRGQIRLEGR